MFSQMLSCLSQQAVGDGVSPRRKLGHMEWSMRCKVPTANAEMMTAMAKLEREIDESASDVVVYGPLGCVPRRRLTHMEWTVRLIQGVDRLGEQHVHVAHTFFRAQHVRKNCAEGGVSNVAESLRAAFPKSLVFCLR